MKSLIMLLLLSGAARAERVVMEGKASTGFSIFVSSLTNQMSISTGSPFTGGTPGVGLYTTSNVVVGGSLAPLILYSTGGINAAGIFGNAAPLVTSSITTTGVLQSSAGFVSGGNSGDELNSSWTTIIAKSTDGATQSSGCVVIWNMSTISAGANAQFTSTTTSPNLNTASASTGVLLETCAPASFCRLGVAGLYKVTASAAISAQTFQLSATRCQITNDANGYDGNMSGVVVGPTVGGAGQTWIRIIK